MNAVLGTDGLPFLAYNGDIAGSPDLRIAHCDNIQCSSATFRDVASGGPVGAFAAVAIGSDGFPILAYQDSTKRLAVAHCTDVACTANDAPTVLDSTIVTAQGNSIAIGSDGFAVISYYYESGKDLKVAHCSNVACSVSTTTTVDAGTTGSFFTGSDSSIAIGTDGLPVISYFDESATTLRFAHCGNPTCTAGNLLTSLTSPGDGGARSALTIGSDGFPIVYYFDHALDRANVAHCTDVACSTSETITVIADANADGGYGSIAILPNGMPVISYYGLTDDLWVAHCANRECTSMSKLAIEGTDVIGFHTSALIGVDGLPFIAYFDDTNNDLKVAHCSNEFCVPYTWRR